MTQLLQTVFACNFAHEDQLCQRFGERRCRDASQGAAVDPSKHHDGKESEEVNGHPLKFVCLLV